MKFDFCIGNPPYQGDNHMQLYPHFYIGGKRIANCVEMIFPIGWQEPKNGRNLSLLNNIETKNDKQIVLIDNRQNVFRGVAGAEWTNIILWKKDYDNKLDGKQLIYTNGENPQKISLDTVKKACSFEQITQVVQKVTKKDFVSIDTIIKQQTRLNLDQLYEDYPDLINSIGSGGTERRIVTNSFEALPVFRSYKDDDRTIAVHGIINSARTDYYIEEKYIDNRDQQLDKWKVILPAAGQGVINTETAYPIISNPFLGQPNEGFTQSFLSFGSFEKEEDAINCMNYIKTKFLRAMVGSLKSSQHNHTNVFANVPLQDFTDNSDIKWQDSIANIDKQLYEKYGLSDEEINFIETNIREMR